MHKQIRVSQLGAESDGRLTRQASARFDLSHVANGDNLRRLLVMRITRGVDNVRAAWERSVHHARITETEIIPPQYLGDDIRFYWSRPFTQTEDRAAVEDESRHALEAAVEAVIDAGFELVTEGGERVAVP